MGRVCVYLRKRVDLQLPKCMPRSLAETDSEFARHQRPFGKQPEKDHRALPAAATATTATHCLASIATLQTCCRLEPNSHHPFLSKPSLPFSSQPYPTSTDTLPHYTLFRIDARTSQHQPRKPSLLLAPPPTRESASIPLQLRYGLVLSAPALSVSAFA